MIDKLRKAAVNVYLITDESVAKELSDLLLDAAKEIEMTRLTLQIINDKLLNLETTLDSILGQIPVTNES
jgi:hypothetical protein